MRRKMTPFLIPTYATTETGRDEGKHLLLYRCIVLNSKNCLSLLKDTGGTTFAGSLKGQDQNDKRYHPKMNGPCS